MSLSYLTFCVCVSVCMHMYAADLYLCALACRKETQVGRILSPSGRGGSVSSSCPLNAACTLRSGYSSHKIFTTGVSLITGTLLTPFSHDAPAVHCTFQQQVVELEFLFILTRTIPVIIYIICMMHI